MPKGYDLYKAQEGAGTKGRQLQGRVSPLFRRSGWGWSTPVGTEEETDLGPVVDPFAGLSTADFLAELGIGGSSGAGSSWSSTPVVPPVLELLGEMRARRESQAQIATNLAEIIGTNVPRGMEFYPGFEMGGVADVLLGIITGEGPSKAQQVLPQGQRTVKRTGIPVPSTNPSVGEEFGDAASLAQAILNSIRVIQTGGSSQQSAASSESAPAPTATITPPNVGTGGNKFRSAWG